MVSAGAPVRAAAVAVAAGLLLAGCTSTDDSTDATANSSASATGASSPSVEPSGSAAAVSSTGPAREVNREIRIGYQEVPSSRILAEVYGRALKDAGFDVALTVPGTLPALVEAMEKGQVDVMPVYSGLFADYLYTSQLDLGGSRAVTPDLESTMAAARQYAEPRGIEVLDPAVVGENASFAVTRDFAEINGISTLSGLAVWSRVNALRLGGDATCEERAFCKPNLEKTYQMRFKEFVPLSSDGTIVKSALEEGSIELGFFTSTDPALTSADLVVLEEDIPLKVIANLAPAVREPFATPEVVETLDAVSAALTEETLGELIDAVEIRGEEVGRAAGEFIAAAGIGEGLFDARLPVVSVVTPRTVDVSAPVASAPAQAAGGPLRISFSPLFDLEFAARAYAGALNSAGIAVRVGESLPIDELLDAASTGDVHMAPVRLNTLANELLVEDEGPLVLPINTRFASELVSQARDLALPLGLAVLPESGADVGNGFVVSDRYTALSAVRSLSDLAKASEAVPITLGGPPECVTASWCKGFLEDQYGVRIAGFVPLDFGGPLSRAAVDRGDVDVAWLSGNDGGIAEFGLNPLRDDLGRDPINPIAPVLVQSAVSPDVARILNRVSAALTTEVVRDANLRVEFEREEMLDVVQEFLRENDLLGIPLAERTAG
jgi:osmoprotectant transport system substrate-binding protein